MLARCSRAGVFSLLQVWKDACIRTASQECSSSNPGRALLCTLHFARAPAGAAESTALAAAAERASSSSIASSIQSGEDDGIASRISRGSQIAAAGSRRYTTTTGPQMPEGSGQADAVSSEGSLSQQQQQQQQQQPQPQQPLRGNPAATPGSDVPQEQRASFSARRRSNGPEQRYQPPPRRGFGGPEAPPAQEFGFQGRSRQLVNLKQRQVGVMSVLSTNNNTIITLSDAEGRVQAWASGGTLGFTNARKSTTHAAEAVAAHMGEKARTLGFTTVTIRVKGMGYGKQKAVRILHSSGLRVTSIEERTPVPHNGCRLPRKRRT